MIGLIPEREFKRFETSWTLSGTSYPRENRQVINHAPTDQTEGPIEDEDEPLGPPNRPWYWEGNVQAVVVRSLTGTQYEIIRAADTASTNTVTTSRRGQAGRLWVTVKGYPVGTASTPPDTEARHWFKDALYDIVDSHGGDSTIRLAIALPDFPIYRKMAERVGWLREVAQF